MRKEKALRRLYLEGKEPIFKENGNLIFRQRFPNTPLIISILALIAALLK